MLIGLPDSIQGRGERLVCKHPAQPWHGISCNGGGVEKAGENTAHGARCGSVRAVCPDTREGDLEKQGGSCSLQVSVDRFSTIFDGTELAHAHLKRYRVGR